MRERPPSAFLSFLFFSPGRLLPHLSRDLRAGAVLIPRHRSRGGGRGSLIGQGEGGRTKGLRISLSPLSFLLFLEISLSLFVISSLSSLSLFHLSLSLFHLSLSSFHRSSSTPLPSVLSLFLSSRRPLSLSSLAIPTLKLSASSPSRPAAAALLFPPRAAVLPALLSPSRALFREQQSPPPFSIFYFSRSDSQICFLLSVSLSVPSFAHTHTLSLSLLYLPPPPLSSLPPCPPTLSLWALRFHRLLSSFPSPIELHACVGPPPLFCAAVHRLGADLQAGLSLLARAQPRGTGAEEAAPLEPWPA